MSKPTVEWANNILEAYETLDVYEKQQVGANGKWLLDLAQAILAESEQPND